MRILGDPDGMVDGIFMARHAINPILTLADGASIVIDAAQGDDYRVTLGGNRTVAEPLNPSEGQVITILVIQDGTGGRTLAWNAAFKQAWSNTGNVAAARSYVSFQRRDGFWWQLGQGPYIA